MSINELDKEEAKNEADKLTEEETNRWLYYDTLRYSYRQCSLNEWGSDFYEKHHKVYKATKDASNADARKAAGISLKEYLKSRFNAIQRQEIDARIQESKREQQNIIDQANRSRLQRVDKYNKDLDRKIRMDKQLIYERDPNVVKEYFSYVLDTDEYSIDCNERYMANWDLSYDRENYRLIIDYKLPTSEEISKVKRWNVNKTNEVVPTVLKDSEFYPLYERILMDIIIRVLALIIDSDEVKVIKEIIFNGFWENPNLIFVISLKLKRDQLNISDVNRVDFVSKKLIEKFTEVNYLGNISLEKETKDLMKRFPEHKVVPIQSNICQNF